MRVPNPNVYRHPMAINAIVHETLFNEEVEWYSNERGEFYPLTANGNPVPKYDSDKEKSAYLLHILLLEGRAVHFEKSEEQYKVYITKKSRNYTGTARSMERALCNAAIQSEM